jgi:hypothetical protein
MTEPIDVIRCPVCGCTPQHRQPDAIYFARQLSIAELLPGWVHDTRHLVEHLHFVLAEIGSDRDPARAVERLRAWCGEGGPGEKLMHGFEAIRRSLRRHGEYVDVRSLGREIQSICEVLRYPIPTLDVSYTVETSPERVNSEYYLTVFRIGMIDALRWISRARQPELRVAIRVDKGFLVTDLLLGRGRQSLQDDEDDERPWGRLRWSVWQLGGTVDIREIDGGAATVSWTIPLAREPT